MRGNLLYKTQAEFATDRGFQIRIYMDLFEIDAPSNPQALFLDRFKFSWIAYDTNNPSRRILVDCHEPFGIHLHIDQQPHLPFEAKTLDDASGFFMEKVVEHFGAIKEI